MKPTDDIFGDIDEDFLTISIGFDLLWEDFDESDLSFLLFDLGERGDFAVVEVEAESEEVRGVSIEIR